MIQTRSACVVNKEDNGVSIERLENRSIVSLKISRKSLDDASERLQLASPLRIADSNPRSLWLAPDQWLLVTDTRTPDAIIEHCRETLTNVLHNAVDQSAALAVFRIAGHGARELLATGCGLDLRPAAFAVGACCRTRLAEIAAIIVAADPEQFEIYVDRSYETYLSEWLADSMTVNAYAAAGQG